MNNALRLLFPAGGIGVKLLRLSVFDESRGWYGAGSMVREYQVKINVGMTDKLATDKLA